MEAEALTMGPLESESEVAQACPARFDSMDCPEGISKHSFKEAERAIS